MIVKCSLCEVEETLDDESPLAKKLRNRPIHTYMCQKCYERITANTNEHFADGHYKRYHRIPKKNDEWDEW